ncbi:hypothetical protein Tsubulata_043912, partial [Turnera subulata]
MEWNKEEVHYDHGGLVPRILSLQADIIYNFIMAFLSPFIAVFSIARYSYRQAERATATVELAVIKVPLGITRCSMKLLRKIAFGIFGAIHAAVVMVAVMLLAVMLGVCLVQICLEEPVYVRERLLFDYSNVNPTAVFAFGGLDHGIFNRKSQIVAPVGHTFHVSLQLLMPESDYNWQVGVFQLTAQVLTEINGSVKAESSQPCILRFRSLPIRLLRTLIMSVPLTLGIYEETQKISVDMIKFKEGHPRTKAIKVTLVPRAGTLYLPQLYEAEILIKSQLPWTKALVRNWKWTCYVWVSLYMYIVLVLLILCCCRPLIFPLGTVDFSYYQSNNAREYWSTEESKDSIVMEAMDERPEVSDLLRKWQQRRKKRKLASLHGLGDVEETAICSSASTMSLSREEDTGDSESVCFS